MGTKKQYKLKKKVMLKEIGKLGLILWLSQIQSPSPALPVSSINVWDSGTAHIEEFLFRVWDVEFSLQGELAKGTNSVATEDFWEPNSDNRKSKALRAKFLQVEACILDPYEKYLLVMVVRRHPIGKKGKHLPLCLTPTFTPSQFSFQYLWKISFLIRKCPLGHQIIYFM